MSLQSLQESRAMQRSEAGVSCSWAWRNPPSDAPQPVRPSVLYSESDELMERLVFGSGWKLDPVLQALDAEACWRAPDTGAAFTLRAAYTIERLRVDFAHR